MASGAKSFVLNRESDWKDKSILKNLEFEKDTLVSCTKIGENGIYISSEFDSGTNETKWHRMRLKASVPPGSLFKLRLYAADSTDAIIPIPGKRGKSKIDINEFIHNEDIDVNRKIDIFEYLGCKIFENPDDILLCDLKGKYLWICLEFINYEEEKIKIKEVKIEFPEVTFLDYLPEIYRENLEENNFVQRFLGIFQSIYVDLEDKIDQTPVMFDVEKTNRDFLDWIANWLSVRNADIWGEKKLRKLIKEAVNIYKMKGTKRAISRIVKEYTGLEPRIVEQFDIKNNMYYDKERKTVEKLFGDNGYIFTVMLPESAVTEAESYSELIQIINSVKPVDSICNLVVLNNKTYLDHHCYMGINSYITKNEKLIINNEQNTNVSVIIK